MTKGCGSWIGAILMAGCGASAPVVAVDAATDAADAARDAAADAAPDALPVGAGCGKALPSDQQVTVPGSPKGYTQYTVMGTGETLDGTVASKAGPRTFWVRVPADYDPHHKYRVVYIGQGCGGFGIANNNTYHLFDESRGGTEQAIYVALDLPTDMANQDCYDTLDGPRSQEWQAFELFHTVVDASYCVDNDNVFVAGFGSGGTLANMWGCYFAGDGQRPWNGDVGGADAGAPAPRQFASRYRIRGQADSQGAEPDNNPPCNGPVAAYWIHDRMSNTPYSGAQAALARVLKMNGCEGSPTVSWHPDVQGVGVCQRYTACPARYPVVFCTTELFGKADQHDRVLPGFRLLFDEALHEANAEPNAADGSAD